MPLSAGTRLGRYELRDLLGAGGMGEVYRAWDHDLEREVAIKILRDGEQRRFVQEAKAASGLHHPNVGHVYEIGIHDGVHFIAMEFVEGETLRKRLARGQMPIDDTLEIAMQIASALASAHKAGIVHRDIKPENVIITSDGYAKVLDFGLAKIRESRGEDVATLVKTSPGIAMGTIGYMSPEQLIGGEVTPAADVFSLGVVIYEMVAGRRPFDGATSTEIVSAILSKPPRPLESARASLPPKLEGVIRKALEKDPRDRYPDASELHDQLRAISREHLVVAPRKRSGVAPKIAIAAALVLAIIAGAWFVVRRNQRRAAMQKIDVAEKLLKDRKLAEAYGMAMEAAAVLPGNDRIRDLITTTSERVKIDSDPPGAIVYLQRYKGAPQRERLGITPLTTPRIARADYLMTLEKPGYATGTRTISTLPVFTADSILNVPLQPIRMKLAEASKLPPGMVLVEGGPYRLSAYYRPSDRVVELRDFFVDRYEVSNRDFEQFIRDGGYRRRELWKYPFIDNGRTLSFEEGIGRFHDTTGLPAPRKWSGGAPPPGRENHPVTDVTWYEASAFAEWKGKKLPTIYQWEKAARPASRTAVANAYPWGDVRNFDVTERANFLGAETMAVDSMPFGASHYGAHHMAGNVSEWCRNDVPPGRAARGGSFIDAAYAFGQTAALPAFFSAPTLGFRCVAGGGGDEGDFALTPTGFTPSYKPVDDRTFAEIARRYEYARDALDARVVERVETPYWTREKIHYTVAGKTVPAYLYLPKGFRRPLQVVHFAPAGDVVGGYRTLAQSIESRLAPFIRGGRAIFGVVSEGFLGRPRPADWSSPETTQAEYVDFNVGLVTEMRRGLDYLETRPDIDRSRIAFLGTSAGGGPGVFMTALEPRYRSVVFAGTGIATREAPIIAAANRINFIPHIRAPKLMLHGRYDEDSSLKSEAEPMFKLLPEPKRLEVYEGGHSPPTEIAVPAITKWYDETMGPAGQ